MRRGDLWQQPWQGCDLVYLFQRPESMARAWDKARAELAPGRFLVSLEFAVPGVAPVAAAGRRWRPAAVGVSHLDSKNGAANGR